MAGTLGENQFHLKDATGLVYKQLLQAGLTRPGTADRSVEIKIMRLYLAQNLHTAIPVAVYQAQVSDSAPFLIRSQLTSMNWSTDAKVAYEKYAQAMKDADERLIVELNARCP